MPKCPSLPLGVTGGQGVCREPSGCPPQQTVSVRWPRPSWPRVVPAASLQPQNRACFAELLRRVPETLLALGAAGGMQHLTEKPSPGCRAPRGILSRQRLTAGTLRTRSFPLASGLCSRGRCMPGYKAAFVVSSWNLKTAPAQRCLRPAPEQPAGRPHPLGPAGWW